MTRLCRLFLRGESEQGARDRSSACGTSFCLNVQPSSQPLGNCMRYDVMRRR